MNNIKVAFILLVFFTFFSRVEAQTEIVDRIVALVGKEPILLSDLNAELELYTLTNKIEPNTPGLREQILDALINEKLLLSKALEDTNLTVSDEEVDRELNVQVAQRVQQLGSEKRVEEAFGMSINRLKLEYRDGMRKKIIIAKLIDARKNLITVSRREVEDFYTQYKDSLPPVPEELELYHIFKIPNISNTSKNNLKSFAQQILDSIKQGGDFAGFARRYSEDPGTKSSGGDLGFVRRGEFFTEFEEAVFSLRENQLSDVVESPIGFHIIQLLERRGEQVHPRHILFKFKRDLSEADSTIAFLKGLKDSCIRGGNFSDLAKRYSDDKESASLGGFLGQLPITQFDNSITDVISKLKEGEISDPVETLSERSRGFQIIYLKKRIQEHTISLSGDWSRIERLAKSFKQNSDYQQWIKQLRSEIYLDVRL